jgi:hypothetical protein
MKILMIATGSIIAVLVLFFIISSALMKNMVTKEYRELLKGDENREKRIYTEKDLHDLPEPVREYIKHTGILGRDMPSFVYLTQKGFFKTKPSAGWMPTTATQLFSLYKRAFIWHGIISMLPGVTMQARDHYKEEKANMLIKLAGSITIGDAKGDKLDQSAFMRFCAEIMWYPWLFLDKELVTWEAVDKNHARGHFKDGKNKGTITFTFNEKHEIVEVAAQRYMNQNGKDILRPWGGLCKDYKTFNGISIPSHVTIYWDLPEGRFECIRLKLQEVDYGIKKL